MKIVTLFLAGAFASLALPAAGQEMTATAVLTDLEGQSLGTLTLTEMDEGISIRGELTGVSNGDHGFHIHETGNCDPASGFESAGAHFEPGDHEHGIENPEGPHAGDLMNITADDDGKATVDLVNDRVTLTEGPSNVLDADGSAIILHADPDDHETDPSGNSGDRIACAVIEGAE